MKTIIIRFALLSILLTVSLSCSSSTETSTDFPDIDGFDATIGENTTMVPPHVSEAALNSYDEENHIYRFDADILTDADIELEEGGIMLIEELALRKITSVSESNGEIEVETEFAALNEAFENLDLNMRQNIEFTPDVIANSKLDFGGNLYSPKRILQNGTVEWEGSFGDFEVEASITPGGTQINMSLLVRYSSGDMSGAMLAQADIQGFTQETIIQIVDHTTNEFSFNNIDMAGEVYQRFIFAGGVTSQETIAPPFPAIIIRTMAGPIPLIFRMDTIVTTEFGLGVNGTAQMETTITYDGNMGFQVKDSRFTPLATGGIENPSSPIAEGNAAGFSGRVHGQFGVAIPNISAQIFQIPAVAYLRQEYYLGASYTFPTCTQLYGRYAANVGLAVDNPTGLSAFDLSQNLNLVDVITHESNSDGCSGSKMLPYDLIHIPQTGTWDIPQVSPNIETE